MGSYRGISRVRKEEAPRPPSPPRLVEFAHGLVEVGPMHNIDAGSRDHSRSSFPFCHGARTARLSLSLMIQGLGSSRDQESHRGHRHVQKLPHESS